jgi:hypothetical protein
MRKLLTTLTFIFLLAAVSNAAPPEQNSSRDVSKERSFKDSTRAKIIRGNTAKLDKLKRDSTSSFKDVMNLLLMKFE